jgi:hypothetical protein
VVADDPQHADPFTLRTFKASRAYLSRTSSLIDVSSTGFFSVYSWACVDMAPGTVRFLNRTDLYLKEELDALVGVTANKEPDYWLGGH